jgi:hypothetical protein
MDVLRQQPVGVAAREDRLEHFARLCGSADLAQRVSVPKVACQEGGFRPAEVVGRRIAHDSPAAHEIVADRIAALDEALVGRRQQAELGEQKDARVEVGLAERAGQRAALFVPGFGQNPLAQGAGVGRPIFGPMLSRRAMPASRSQAAQHRVAE